MTKRKLTSIPLEEKYYAIQRIEKKECTQEKIASEFGVNKATVSRWMSKEQINGPIVLKKAEYFATLHGYKDFKPSNCWLDRWKKRFGLSFVIMNGESEKVDDVTVDTWKARLSTLIASYASNDIFNADETGLFRLFG